MEALSTPPVIGLALDGKICIALAPPAAYVQRVVHEGGHLLAEALSFKRRQVLSPEQTKHQTIPLSLIERGWLLSEHFRRSTNMTVPEEILLATSVASKLLRTFSKGNFDFDKVEVIYGNTYGNTMVGQILKTVESAMKPDQRAQRIVEIPAYFTERACLGYLRNSLATPQMPVPFGQPRPPESPAHRQAFQIVEMAYQNGWMVPSMVDRKALAA